jgi:hypothetical protein
MHYNAYLGRKAWPFVEGGGAWQKLPCSWLAALPGSTKALALQAQHVTAC